MEDTIKAVNFYIFQNAGIIHAKKIRRCLNISGEDRSKINFIWRNLKVLSEKGYITLEKEKKSKYNVYKLPKKIIRIEELRRNNNGKKKD